QRHRLHEQAVVAIELDEVLAGERFLQAVVPGGMDLHRRAAGGEPGSMEPVYPPRGGGSLASGIFRGRRVDSSRRRRYGRVVLPGAYGAAFASLRSLPAQGGTWTEVTNRPYDLDDPRYRDPVASNSSGGWGLASGRITGLAAGGGALYIGGAAGGVFRSLDG